MRNARSVAPLASPLATEGFPEDLDRVLARRVDPAVLRDNAWRADGRDLPLNRWSWGERDGGAMAEVWDAEADRLADELIEMWRWAWVCFMPRAARERHPELVARVRKLVADHRVAPDLVRASGASERIEMTIEWALWFGAHDLVRQRRDWPDPPADATCAICGATFVPALGSEWIFRVYGVERYCGACIGRAIGGVQTTSRARIRRGLRRLAALLGCPPPANLRRSLSIAALPAERRDAFMCALMTAIYDKDGVVHGFGIFAGSGAYKGLIYALSTTIPAGTAALDTIGLIQPGTTPPGFPVTPFPAP